MCDLTLFCKEYILAVHLPSLFLFVIHNTYMYIHAMEHTVRYSI